MTRWWIGRIAAGIAFFVAAAFALGFVVMSLWNALIPELFHGPTLTYFQALGLLILSHLLLRGAGPWDHRKSWKDDRWKQHMRARYTAMTPEEQKKYRDQWRSRCGWDPMESEGKTGESTSAS